MMESLTKHNMDKYIKKALVEAIENKIRKEDLTATVSALNSVRSNNM